MTPAERKRKSRAKKLLKMTEEEKLQFKEKERERSRKAMQIKRLKDKQNMTPTEINDFKEEEAKRLRALRYKKRTSEQGSKEKVKALLKIASKKQKNPYKNRQSFSKALNKVRAELPLSPRKKAAVVQGIASEFGYQFKNDEYDATPNARREKIVNFYKRSDIVYTMPGKGDEMTIWTENGKEKLRKHYLTMFLREAYALYIDSCDNDDDKCGFTTFRNLRPKNVLLLGSSPAHQCKCQVHENLFLKLEAMGMTYDSSWWESILCSTIPNSDCWINECETCKDGKNFVPAKMLNALTSYKQWEEVEVPSTRKSNGDEPKTYTKIVISEKHVQVGEVLEQFQESFAKVKHHQNTKRIQAAEFQNDIQDPSKRVLQIDYAQAYQCELQNEIMSALWSRGSVNLFTCAVYHDSETKTLVFGTNYKGKDKFSTGLFIETLYKEHIPPNEDIQEEIIWSDGPTSEFKNRFMCNLVKKLALMFNKPFSWKFSATSHGKGVVDGVGGRVKSLVHQKVMSLGRNRSNVQDAESFCALAKQLNKTTTVIYVSPEEVDNYKDTNPFADAVPVDGISKMHFMRSDGVTTHLWENSSYYNNAKQASITLPLKKCQQTQSSDPPLPEAPKIFSYHDVVKITKGNFVGYYAIITETGDLSEMSDVDEVEINYLKQSYNKWVINENDLDSRELGELKHVEATIDMRSRYTIME